MAFNTADRSWYTRFLNKATQLALTNGLPNPDSLIGKMFAGYLEKYHLRRITLNPTGYPSSDIFWAGHTPEDLARTLKEFVKSRRIGGRNFGINSTQRMGLGEYKRLRACEAPDNLDPTTLKKYYLAFNKVFFLGALRNLVVTQNFGAHPSQNGDCSSHDNSGRLDIPARSGSLITLYDRRASFTSNDELLKAYLLALLYELIHVRGSSWHGPVWQESAYAIEKATALLLDEPLLLGRQTALVNEWHMKGCAPPESEIDVTAWGLEYPKVHEEFRSRRGGGA